MRVRLLRDIRTVFEARKLPRTMATSDLLAALARIEEAPWLTYYGRGLDSRDLASLLHHYGITSTTVRLKVRVNSKRKGSNILKGYKRDDLYEAWERYL
jgi:hypothetical protein